MDKFSLKSEQAVLMIIDIQERLVPVMEYGEQVIRNTNILLSAARRLGIPVVVTEQYPKGLGKTVREISDNIEMASVYEKITFSACIPELISDIEKLGRKKVIITGMETHVCLYQTVRDLISLGYQVFVVKDGVCSRTMENHQNGLLLMSQMGAVITNTETILFDLLREAGTPLFKELSKLIK